MLSENTSSKRQEAQLQAESASTALMILGGMNWLTLAGITNILPLYFYLKLGSSVESTGILLFFATACGAITTPIWIHFGHTWGFGRIVTYSFIPTIIFSVGMAVVDRFVLLVLMYSTNALFNIPEAVTRTFVAVIMPRKYAEEWIAVNSSINNTLFLVGMMMMSIFFQFISYDAPFWISCAIASVAFLYGMTNLVGIQENVEDTMLKAYHADVKEQGHDDKSPDYVTGIVHEREEFPIVLHTYDAYQETFDFWNLSQFEAVLFALLTLLYSSYVGSMWVLVTWWPLFCSEKWGVPIMVANAQLVLCLVFASISVVCAPRTVDWFAKSYFSLDSTYTEISEDNRGDYDEYGLTQNARDQATIVQFAISCVIAIPLWCVFMTPISFNWNWFIMIIVGWNSGWGSTCIAMLVLRFQRAGDLSQMFGIQGFCWQMLLAILHLSVGFVWETEGYDGLFYVPTLLAVLKIIVSYLVYRAYEEEKRWNVKE